MKITTDDPDLLILEEVPLFWAGFSLIGPLTFGGVGIWGLTEDLWGPLLFIAIGIMWFMAVALVVERQQLILDRQGERALFRRKSIYSYSQSVWSLAEVAALYRDSRNDSDGSTYRYHLRLRSGEVIPLGAGYTNVGRPEQIATRATEWLDRAPSAA